MWTAVVRLLLMAHRTRSKTLRTLYCDRQHRRWRWSVASLATRRASTAECIPPTSCTSSAKMVGRSVSRWLRCCCFYHVHLWAMCLPLNSDIISQVNLRQTTLQLGLWAAVDDMKHCLAFATPTLVKSLQPHLHFLWHDVRWRWFKFWPVSSWHIWLPDSRVIDEGRVDHRGRLPVILPWTGDVYRMSVCPDSRWVCMMTDSCKKEKIRICVTANLHVKLSSQTGARFTKNLRKNPKFSISFS